MLANANDKSRLHVPLKFATQKIGVTVYQRLSPNAQIIPQIISKKRV